MVRKTGRLNSVMSMHGKIHASKSFIKRKNGGLVSARNAGYEVTTGDWLMYLDGDDWIDTDTCEKLVKYLGKYPDVDIVFWKCIQELGSNSIKGKWEWTCREQEHLYVDDECHELARHTLVYKSGIATAYCKLIRADYAKTYGISHDDRLRQGAEGLEFRYVHSIMRRKQFM